MRVLPRSRCLEHDSMSSIEESKSEQPKKPSRAFIIGWTIAIVGVFVASAGFVFAHQTLIERQTGDLKATAASGMRVLVVPIESGGTGRLIQLPATIHGYVETPVYAKVAGYMK